MHRECAQTVLTSPVQCQADDAVLIANRIGLPPIPIVDEVAAIGAVPLGQPAASKVASPGSTIQTLCNPYGLATIFDLDPARPRGSPRRRGP